MFIFEQILIVDPSAWSPCTLLNGPLPSLHALVRLIRRLRQRRLLGVRIIWRLRRPRLLGIRLVWRLRRPRLLGIGLVWRLRRPRLLGIRLVRRLRQCWLLGALRVRRRSWIGQRRFGRFVSVRSRVADHDMAPGKWNEEEAGDHTMPGSAATTFSYDPFPIYTDGAPCRGGRDVHNCSFRENYAGTPAATSNPGERSSSGPDSAI
jgi:hypothetical protein